MRLSKLVRHGGDARLLALDDSLWGRPLYAGQARGDGALASYPHAVSGRLAVPGAVSRFGRRDAVFADRAREGRAVVHEYARRAARFAAHSGAAAQGHEADCDDHRRQTLGAHAARWANLQERLWPGPAGGERNPGRSGALQAI